VHAEALMAARAEEPGEVKPAAGGQGGRCLGWGAAQEPGEVKPVARLLGHSSVAVWHIDDDHGKWSEASGRAEAG
jgi:hypothetical protein